MYLRLDSDSLSPQIPRGALLTIRKVDSNEDITEVDPRKLYYLELNALTRTVRYMNRIRNQVILLPNNKNYPAEIYDIDENLISILGTVESWYCDIKA